MADEANATAILDWLADCGDMRFGQPPSRVVALAGDVSPRRYYRLEHATGRAIAVRYGAGTGTSCERFVATSALLREAGVRVPEILAVDCGRGCMVVEDLGDQTLYEMATDWAGRAPYFERAVDVIARVQTLPTPVVDTLNPPLDRELLERELAQTWERFLLPNGLAGQSSERAELENALAILCTELAATARVPCHRDFMARNLVPLPDFEVGVLDHQDLRAGPRHYDLASLLNDSLFPPPDLEATLLRRALGPEPAAAERLGYHRAAAQRTLKAVGTFAAFAARGADRHLPLIPPTLRRALHHLRQIPETAPLAPALERRWAPALAGSPSPT